MGNDIESISVGPVLCLLVVGILISSFLFYFMFKYAEEGNLVMVILIPLLVSIISIVIGKSFIPNDDDLPQE